MGIESYYTKDFTVRREEVATGDWGDTGVTVQELPLKGYIKYSPGQVVFVDGKPTPTATHKLFCPVDTDIAVLDEVFHRRATYKVLSVLDASGMGHHLECLLEVIK